MCVCLRVRVRVALHECVRGCVHECVCARVCVLNAFVGSTAGIRTIACVCARASDDTGGGMTYMCACLCVFARMHNMADAVHDNVYDKASSSDITSLTPIARAHDPMRTIRCTTIVVKMHRDH